MIIIAIPKSASTSLLKSYAKRHGLRCFMGSQGFVRTEIINEIPFTSGYSLLSKYHMTDFKEIQQFMVEKYKNPNCIYKSHIAPSENNKKYLKSIKKVVLLREPVDVIKAYYRADAKNIHSKKTEFYNLLSEHDWVKKAEEIGLIGELESFYTGWKRNCNSEETLLINYDELIDNPNEVFLKMDRFYGLPEYENQTELLKEKYSRNSKIQKIKIMVKKMYTNA